MAVLLAVLLLSLHNDDVQFTLEEAGKAGSQPELLTATLRAISEASIHYHAPPFHFYHLRNDNTNIRWQLPMAIHSARSAGNDVIFVVEAVVPVIIMVHSRYHTLRLSTLNTMKPFVATFRPADPSCLPHLFAIFLNIWLT